MSETTIGNLPEEVLLEVFKWLDSKSLKNVEQTSEEWKEIVERSMPRYLDLNGKDSMEALMDSLLVSRRKYSGASISGPVESQQKLLEVFEIHGANVRQLSISHSDLYDARIWCQVLETMPKLKKVGISCTKSGDSWKDLSAEDLPKEKDLNKLDSLDFEYSNNILLKLFEKCQLKTVCMSSSHEDREPLLNFMATQEGLEELKLSVNRLFSTPIPDEFIPFRLKKLTLWQHVGFKMPDQNYNNLLNFMRLHSGTLEELVLYHEFPDFFHEFVFSKLKRLKTLSLKESEIPQDSGFYDRLEVNRSVTNLYLIGVSHQREIDLKGLISRLPNIKSLSLNNIRGLTFIDHLAKTLKKFKKLRVVVFNGKTFDGVRFEALESLEIGIVNGPVNWDAFTTENPGIKELSIGYVWKQKYLDISTITKNLKKLHTLTIKESEELNCDEKFFDIIRQNCKELKSLNLNAKSLKMDISAVADIPGLRFRNFPR